MNQVIEIFLKLVKSEILATPLEDGVAKSVTPDMLKQLYALSKQHDMAHIVAAALEKNNLLGEDEISKKMRNSMYMAVWRDELREKELQQIYQLFEEEHIAFIPLKGAVIRELYPEPWMRTSCDIDILVREEEVERAKDVLVSKLSYRVDKYLYRDISLYSDSNVHIELHHSIMENMSNIDQLLGKVWEYASGVIKGGVQYQMIPEYFMFHLFAHMSFHFMQGGCGIRNFVDIWLLESKLEYDKNIVNRFCETCGIGEFVEYVRKLIRVWFGDDLHDAVSERMHMYIVDGGLYGTIKSSLVTGNVLRNGKMQYLLHRVFMPYRDLCIIYPKLRKKRVLYPYYTLRRWVRFINAKRVKRVIGEIKTQQGVTPECMQNMRELFEKLKLM